MGKSQDAFLAQFRAHFEREIASDITWAGGQGMTNRAGFPHAAFVESFELGDARTEVNGRTVVVEFDTEWVSLQNLLKFWPYLRGELSASPARPVLLCHFSNWKSYGSYRHLWDWLVAEMSDDRALIVPFAAQQFNHGGSDAEIRSGNIAQAIQWLRGELALT